MEVAESPEQNHLLNHPILPSTKAVNLPAIINVFGLKV